MIFVAIGALRVKDRGKHYPAHHQARSTFLKFKILKVTFPYLKLRHNLLDSIFRAFGFSGKLSPLLKIRHKY